MMAAVMEKHVEMPGDDAEPQLEDNDDQSGSEGENEEEGSDDGGDEEEGSEDGGDEEEGSEDGGDEEEGSDDGGDEEEGSDDGESNGEEADDADDDGDKEELAGEGEGEGNTNAGWAEAMAKILGKKTAPSKSIILVKNKELDKMKERERQEQQERKKQVDEKRSWEMMSREKPDIVVDRETERALQRIATRGVVQLFNAVKKHQKNVDDKVKEVGGSERKKAKILGTVSKRDFIDVLRRTEEGPRGTGTPTDTAAAAEEKPAWSILRDDFMMGATMKDWDKDSDKEETEP
ncbi:RRP15-like protein isoform X1 [Pleuronectes platessa]|uniref:RRP15-like protein isoform X1 n=1 Tax=Pleuronectes platessa TaxID=8262 RepID=UPI00232A1A0B|nr:RRP15-like protein isoform X1 [Pleuronectes platessa]